MLENIGEKIEDTEQQLATNPSPETLQYVIKVLTIFASIFIPLTFFVGVYGMNFNYLPDLEGRWGYFGFWGVSILAAGSMVLCLRRKRWL